MTRPLPAFILLAMVGFALVAAAETGRPSSSDLISSIKPPAAFTSRAARTLSQQYPSTSCLDFSLKKSRKNVGYLCATGDEQFLRDSGVHAQEQGNSGREPPQARQVSIASGIASYPAERLVLKSGATIFVAEVDCDLKNESVYRPTGTCHVAVHYLQHGGAWYSNFVMQDHAGKKKMAKKQDIISLWESLPITD